MIVLSSDQAVKDLLDKRGAIYSDRPDMYMAQTLGSDGLRFVMMVSDPYSLITNMAKVLICVALWADLANGKPASLWAQLNCGECLSTHSISQPSLHGSNLIPAATALCVNSTKRICRFGK